MVELDRSRSCLGLFDTMRGYFVNMKGASLTFSVVVTSDERERQSRMVLTTQSEGMLKVEDPALDQAMYVLESWL
jgi:hypothetical protein